MDLPNTIRGLIFDCDGTIADTMPLHYQAWSAALGQHGQDFPEAMFYQLAGIPTIGTIEVLNERHGYQLPVQETAAIKERLFEAMIQKVGPIEPIVAIARQHEGRLPMAVATGATRSICIQTLVALGLVNLFTAIVTADDVQQGKPAPDIFLESARRLGLPPNACCVFEDGELGLQAGRAAGMMTVDVRPIIARSRAPG